MKTYNSVGELAAEMGCDTLHELGRYFYKQTERGVSTTFVFFNNDWLNYSEVSNFTVTRKLPNIVAGGIKSILFTTIVEGYDATFQASPIDFPCSELEIERALKYLENLVDEFLIENND